MEFYSIRLREFLVWFLAHGRSNPHYYRAQKNILVCERGSYRSGEKAA